MTARGWLLPAALACLLAPGAVAQPRRAVPVNGPVDVDELLRLARISQALNARTYLLYSFRQTTREEILDAEGGVKRTETRVYRVIPSRLGTTRHLLETDGEPPSPREVRKQQARNEKLARRWEKIRKKQRKQAERRRERAAAAEPSPPGAGASTPRGGEPAPPAAPPPPSSAAAPSGAASPSPEDEPAPAEVPAGVTGRPPAVQREASPRTLADRLVGRRLEPSGEDLPPIPRCSIEDPLSSLRPPLPGSKTSSSRRNLDSSSEAARRARKTAGDYTIFELLSLTAYEYEGACRHDERVVHVVSFSPDESFDPQNPVERVVTAMEGVIFIDADDVQVTRTEGRTVAPIKWGAGMVALREAHVVFEARKVNDEVWLPAADLFEFDSRVLFDRDRQRFTHYYDDYKKLSVSTEEVFEGVTEESVEGAGPAG